MRVKAIKSGRSQTRFHSRTLCWLERRKSAFCDAQLAWKGCRGTEEHTLLTTGRCRTKGTNEERKGALNLLVHFRRRDIVPAAAPARVRPSGSMRHGHNRIERRWHGHGPPSLQIQPSRHLAPARLRPTRLRARAAALDHTASLVTGASPPSSHVASPVESTDLCLVGLARL